MIHTLEHGEITLKTNNTETLQIKIQNNTIDINILHKEPIKALLKLQTPSLHIEEVIRNLKTTAEQLKHAGITVKISYKNQPVLTIGAQAHPTLSQIITGTNTIEINNPIQLTQLLT